MDSFEQFIKDRNEALLSLDRNKIQEYMIKYKVMFKPLNDEVFWRAIHKARTAIKTMPIEAIELSEKWLKEHNSESWRYK